MPRNGEDARQRLQQAALELFGERGYDQTTAFEIAARAGVTERTFFRHFSDKREVLFDGQAKLRAALTSAIAQAPDGLPPLEILYWALRSIERLIEDNRPFAVPRQHVIASSSALQERELAKIAALEVDLAGALQQRGVDAQRATLASAIGMTAFDYAVTSWFADPSRRLTIHLDQTFAAISELASSLAHSETRRRATDSTE